MRLLAELAAAKLAEQLPSEALASWVSDRLETEDGYETVVLASGLKSEITDIFIRVGIERTSSGLLIAAVRALSLGADCTPESLSDLVKGLIKTVGSADHAEEAARALSQIPVPPSHQAAALASIAAHFNEPENTIFRAVAMDTWKVDDAARDDALLAVLMVQPKPRVRKRILSKSTGAEIALAAAARRLLPAEPSLLPDIVGAARRLNLSLNGIEVVDEALRELGHAGAIWKTVMPKLSEFKLPISDDWLVGIRMWLQQLSETSPPPMTAGETRRIATLRAFASTVAFAEAVPRDLTEAVNAGEATEVSSVVCTLADIDPGRLGGEASAFLEAYPLTDDLSRGLDRLFDGVAKELDHWERVSEPLKFRLRLIGMLAGTDISATVAASAIQTDPNPEVSRAALLEVFKVLAGRKRRLAAELYLALQPGEASQVIEWSQNPDPQLRIVAARHAMPLYESNNLGSEVLIALAGDEDESVRVAFSRSLDKVALTPDLRSALARGSSAPAVLWTCVDCGATQRLDDLRCSQCAADAPMTIVAFDVDADPPGRRQRRAALMWESSS